MATVEVRSFRELQILISRLGMAADRAVEKAFRDTARFGVAAALRTSAKTKPRPKASGTYENSFVVTKVPGGAVLSNSAKHAIFVERGRKPGRRPPQGPITEWVYLKRLAKRPKPKFMRDAPKSPMLRAAEKWLRDEQRKNKSGGDPKKRGPKKPKRKEKRSRWQVDDVEDFVEKVRWKIAKKGIPGRYVLRRTMPIIAKRAKREIGKAIRKVCATPPR
jgi:hypothetical protein